MMAKKPLILLAGWICFGLAGFSPAVAESVIAPGAKLEKLAGDLKFAEGPTSDTNGNVFFTDQPNDRILEWSADGKLSTFLQPAGRANGMYFDAKGSLIACADEKNELWAITPGKKVTVLIKDYQGKYLNGPNDVWVAPDGGMYITDPFYKRTWWNHDTMAQDGEQVYYLSPDGKKLFVADIGADRTYACDIQPDGSLTNKTLFCPKGSDGMTIDERGDLYLCGHGVTVFDKTGRQIERIDVPEPWSANVSFGGKDHQTLFIAASKSLYSIHLIVKGANPAK